jgi:CheY-like chemotaxis protein
MKKKLSILIAEPNAIYRKLLVNALGVRAEVTAAPTAPEAIAACQKKLPRGFDLAIIVNTPPAFDGLALCGEIRKIIEMQTILVLGPGHEKRQAYRPGAITHMIEKKSTFDEVLQIVDMYEWLGTTNETEMQTQLLRVSGTALHERIIASPAVFEVLNRFIAKWGPDFGQRLFRAWDANDCISLLGTYGTEFSPHETGEPDYERMDLWLKSRVWSHFTDHQIYECYKAFSSSASPYRDPDFVAILLLYFSNRILKDENHFELNSAQDQILTVIQLGLRSFRYLIECQPKLFFHLTELAHEHQVALPRESKLLLEFLDALGANANILKRAIAEEKKLPAFTQASLIQLVKQPEIPADVCTVLLKRGYHMRLVSQELMKQLLNAKTHSEDFFTKPEA